MSLIDKITSKFQNLIRFEKLNPSGNFGSVDVSNENQFNGNIELFKKAIIHKELKNIIWIAIYHCLNTYCKKNEFLTVIDKNCSLIVDLIEGSKKNVDIPKCVFNEYENDNILAIFHNHFEGAIIPSINDFNNSILPKINYSIITSQNNIGIIVNGIKDSDLTNRAFNDFKLFEIYLNFCFSNDELECIEYLENNFKGNELKNRRETLFNLYLAKNLEKFINEFNFRMEKYNVYCIYIRL